MAVPLKLKFSEGPHLNYDPGPILALDDPALPGTTQHFSRPNSTSSLLLVNIQACCL